MSKTNLQFGLWPSPISPGSLAQGISFSDIAWDDGCALVWREGRSDRGVLVVLPPNGEAARDLNSDFSMRAGVGYGGGDFGVRDGKVFFVEASSKRIYSQPISAGSAHALTPAFGAAASPKVSPDGNWLLYVHSYEGQDALALVDTQGSAWPIRMVAGNDFYMQPAWNPDSQRFAYIAWDHPNMPWDGTALYLGELGRPAHGAPFLENVAKIFGGETVSVFQPEFSPDGRYLAYVSDQTGWWQLYIYDLETRQTRQLTDELAEHGTPAWVQGKRTYAFNPKGGDIFFIRNRSGVQSLSQVDLEGGKARQIQFDQDYTSLDQIAVAKDGKQIALIASGGSIPERLILCDQMGKTRVIRRSVSEELSSSTYAVPQSFSWSGMDSGDVYGLFYLPHSESYSSGGLPPLLVHIHGGPTSQRVAGFNLEAQFFTSRGYAYLEVNYRGSTGYGRAYRDMLKGNWGIYDVQDAVSGARALMEKGLVDGERLVIMGGSAGGFTVLKAIEDYPGFFKAGICLYGVSNQFTLAADTHKFEARYSDSLLGPLPEATAIYRERSPIFFADRIKDPLLIFQGEDDVVVPRAQSDEIVKTLRARGVPHEYHLYPGEGHGFRKSETILHFYQTVEKFLRQYVIFS
jgi:dipeptidyl aminopeptidase/acylaminoacyl peptidase